MRTYRVAGTIWILAAVLAVATTIIFRDDATAWIVTNAASIVAAIIGVLLIRSASQVLVSASILGGIAWVLLYAALALVQAADIQAWTADAFLGAVGGVAAFTTYRAGTREGGADGRPRAEGHS